MIKKFQRDRKLPDNLDIIIISAKYGFLKADRKIDDYDMRMTKKRAQELHPRIVHEMKEFISHKEYKEVFINLGKDYLPAIEGIENLTNCPIVYAPGRIGEKMSALKKWLIKISCSSKDQKTLTEVLKE